MLLGIIVKKQLTMLNMLSHARRWLSVSQNSETIMNVFDRKTKQQQKDRTALLDNFKDFDYLKEEIGFQLSDRVCDVNRSFESAAEIGCGRGYIGRHLTTDMVKQLIQCDMSHQVLRQIESSPEVVSHVIQADEEHLPFAENSLDLVLSCLSLHWVNDLPGCFRQVHQCLRPDGCFLGAMLGGDTLYELRVALQQAETKLTGGISARVSPFTDVRDLGNLLTRAGFSLLTIDTDELVVNFPSIKEVMRDLKGMGESNCSWKRRHILRRDVIAEADVIYREMYGQTDGSIPATFQVIYMIGWKPDPSQIKAARRGSGEVSLKDLSRLDELGRELSELREKQEEQIGTRTSVETRTSTDTRNSDPSDCDKSS